MTLDPNDIARVNGAEGLRQAWDQALIDRGAPKREVNVKKAFDSSVSDDKQRILKNSKDIWPDPAPLPTALTPVDDFDFAFLPAPLAQWGEDIAERLQCPSDYVGASLVTAVSSVIGRKVGIRLQRNTDWTVIPNIWAALIGRPGVLKTPAMEATLTHIKRLAALANNDYKAALTSHKNDEIIFKLKRDEAEKKARKALKDNADADVQSHFTDIEESQPPRLKRYITSDATPAALGALLIDNPNGILVHRDELVSLLRGLDREDNAEGRGFYLTGWNGDTSYTFDRIGRGGNLHIEGVCISLLGSTQPGRISNYLRSAIKGDGGDDGLSQRFGLLIWPNPVSDWKDVDRPPNIAAKNAVWDIFKWLDTLDPEKIGCHQGVDIDGNAEDVPYLRFDGAALEKFLEWRTKLEKVVLKSDDLHPALESHFAKYRKLVPALALIFHLASRKTGSVELDAITRALRFAEYLESHAIRAYSSVTAAQSATAKQILKRIRNGDIKGKFKARDIYRKQWSQLSDISTVGEGLRMLCDYDFLAEETRQTGGRPKTVYTINPKVQHNE